MTGRGRHVVPAPEAYAGARHEAGDATLGRRFVSVAGGDRAGVQVKVYIVAWLLAASRKVGSGAGTGGGRWPGPSSSPLWKCSHEGGLFAAETDKESSFYRMRIRECFARRFSLKCRAHRRRGGPPTRHDMSCPRSSVLFGSVGRHGVRDQRRVAPRGTVCTHNIDIIGSVQLTVDTCMNKVARHFGALGLRCHPPERVGRHMQTLGVDFDSDDGGFRPAEKCCCLGRPWSSPAGEREGRGNVAWPLYVLRLITTSGVVCVASRGVASSSGTLHRAGAVVVEHGASCRRTWVSCL